MYAVGKTIKVTYVNSDIWTSCGHGINLCPTLELAKEWGDKVVKIQVNIKDIGCIPIEDKKFRVKKCKVIEEIE